MLTRSKLGFLISGIVLAGVLLAGGVALSQKTVTVAARPIGCDNAPALDKATKTVGQIIESGHWTTKDHDQVRPLLHFLHTDQKIELMRKVSAAIQAKKLVLDKGAHLFF